MPYTIPLLGGGSTPAHHQPSGIPPDDTLLAIAQAAAKQYIAWAQRRFLVVNRNSITDVSTDLHARRACQLLQAEAATEP